MPTTLLFSPPGHQPTALLEALTKEATDVSAALAALFGDGQGPGISKAELATVFEPLEQARVLCHPALAQWVPALRMSAEALTAVFLLDVPPVTPCEPLALARLERWFRHSLCAIEGLRTLVVPAGIGASEMLAALDALSRGARVSFDANMPAPPAIEAAPEPLMSLLVRARQLVGGHTRFEPGELGREGAWTSELLDLDDAAREARDALVFASRQLAELLASNGSSASAAEQEGEDDDDQFREPGDGESYRLNASEDRAAYHRWLSWNREPTVIGGEHDPPLRRAVTRRRRGEALISVVMPVYRTPRWALERAVGSVLAQRFSRWELCICDDGSGDPELTAYLRSLHRIDRRISVVTSEQNGGISDATNRALGIAKAPFVAFLDHDDELHPRALAEAAAVLEAVPDADFLYSDEDKVDATGERFDPLFKPDWSPDLLLSFAYTCHLAVIRRSLVGEIGGIRREFDGSQDYDLALRASERARKIVHIPDILYHWRALSGSAATDSGGRQAKPWAYAAGRRAIEDAMKRRGEPAEVTMIETLPGRYHVRRAITSHPLVSVIVPFRDEPALLATCARTLRQAPGYAPMELVLVDNGSVLPETATLLEELDAQPDVRIVQAPGPFNWAAINNQAARACDGELLLFLNNDIEAQTPGWLDALVGHALRDEVGAVGARLLYPDGSIQHAGVVIGLGGIAGHVLRGLPGNRPGYNSLAVQTRDCSVVTGAAMMVRRSVFEEVGGFNEELAVAFNDVDFCLKLRERGYLVVYTPLAELIHHESKSRGHTDDFAESRHMMERWADFIVAGDPYMNVHLSHWRYWCPLSTAQEADRWRNYLETRVLTPGSSSSAFGG